ncbi:MAG: SDR family oxidoreductase, partial [Actinobacteria bacterium]|nr:SDR family oxidoreductase [Actinomycetota bacterium]
GIGRACAVAMAAAGAATVVLADIDATAAAAAAELLRSRGTDAWSSGTDVSDVGGQRALFAALDERHGGLDILCNNAGVMSGEPVWPETPLEELARTVGVNLGGVIYGTRCAIPAMRRRGGGVIVNMASRAALSTGEFDPAYHATKAAVVNFTQCCRGLADRYGIRVNAVLPGVVDTPLLGKTGDGGRMASWLAPIVEKVTLLDPTAIAEAVTSLVVDDSQVGTCLVVDNPPARPFRVGEWSQAFMEARR